MLLTIITVIHVLLAAGLIGHCPSPGFLMTQIPPVADESMGFAGQLNSDLVGCAAAQNEVNTAAFERRGDLRQSLKHESVVACVRLRIAAHQAEAHQQGFAVLVSPARGMFQCGVVFRPLTLLHPVQHILAVAGLALAQQLDLAVPAGEGRLELVDQDRGRGDIARFGQGVGLLVADVALCARLRRDDRGCPRRPTHH